MRVSGRVGLQEEVEGGGGGGAAVRGRQAGVNHVLVPRLHAIVEHEFQ